MYKIEIGSKFDQKLKSIAKRDRKYQIKVKRIVELLQVDIDHPSLRMHKLSGTKYYSISVDKSIRIILTIERNTVFLVKIGKHEEVY
ncbi:MAG: type II toxin-antitoxin system YafQ family toxin [Oligoflexia bacterium]|nr:type II toxin-antitoxin system YafQ family toxin [Oligoflexia bacterium]